ncbi:glycyl radical protein [Desulforhopalus singaporensis]|uniref:Formate C-acetyltransferase n=1 Tax=Desulforhopalus singaporensis TaxID=91360 RepID=A0A1H0KFX4_9BACT|nr:pyruvate formate lyase family protein [Desulforhopalus singaporensis]SDO54878.1 formate C-acetyltransferase [Desulforhopalus singaporensis]
MLENASIANRPVQPAQSTAASSNQETGNDRTRRLKNAYLQSRPTICMERAAAFTRSFKKTEGQARCLRLAKAFRHACETITINIFDDELVVGTHGSGRRMGALVPEISWKWLNEELDTIETRPRDPYYISPEHRKLFLEEIVPYWKTRSLEEKALAQFPAETLKTGVNTDILDTEMKWRSHVGEITPDFQDIVFPKGFRKIRDEAREKLEELKYTEIEDLDKIEYYQSSIEACEGIMTLGRRYAEKAEAMAKVQTDPQRRQELAAIGANCRRVPAESPRNFWEAAQMCWFVMMSCFLSENCPAFNVGRFDMFMNPFFQDDLETKTITGEFAQEIINCLWIKIAELIWLLPKSGSRYYAGYSGFTNLSVGGRNFDGSDAVNEISYMAVEATSRVGLPQPSLSVIIHPDTPEDFLLACCRLARQGIGFPAFHNDRVGVQMMMYAGLRPDDAREWTLLGCVVPHHRKVYEWTDAGGYNMAAALEWTLNRGRSRITGEQMGLPTKDPREFSSFNELKETFFTQVRHILNHCAISTIIEQRLHRQMVPRPFLSLLVEGCMESGSDLVNGGARYNIGPGWIVVGAADCANGLAAIRKNVFEEKNITMDQLLKALDDDFVGHEEIHEMLKNSPKFGNDDDYVDRLQVEMTDFNDRGLSEYTDILGNPFHSAIMGLTYNIPTGSVVGALPCGRKATTPLAEGCSPHPGTDTSGPTASMRSEAKVNHELHPGGTLLNLKLLPSAIEGQRGLAGMANLIRSYFELGGYHCQFNVISQETLRDAQANPDDYRDLVIRVAGYCAIFTELSPEVQNEVIRRTSHESL